MAWLIVRFSPLLRLQARYRLRGALQSVCDPDDLVNDVWVTALPRLGDLRERDGRMTPVLLRLLGTTLLHKANHLIVKHLRRSDMQAARDELHRLADDITTACSKAQEEELHRAVVDALLELDESDREVLVLRGIEQLPNEDAARLVGVSAGALTRRYHKALERLRHRLPGSIFDELPTP